LANKLLSLPIGSLPEQLKEETQGKPADLEQPLNREVLVVVVVAVVVVVVVVVVTRNVGQCPT